VIAYGPRDAVSVLMGRGHKVGIRWNGRSRWRVLDGRAVSLRELEDQAETYERLRYRHTPRADAR
jgi:hypothetical protein